MPCHVCGMKLEVDYISNSCYISLYKGEASRFRRWMWSLRHPHLRGSICGRVTQSTQSTSKPSLDSTMTSYCKAPSENQASRQEGRATQDLAQAGMARTLRKFESCERGQAILACASFLDSACGFLAKPAVATFEGAGQQMLGRGPGLARSHKSQVV